MRLHRYWFKFKQFNVLTVLNLGCGVTAFDREDALKLMNAGPFASDLKPEIVACIKDVDIRTLDPKHVLPNIGNPSARGVWFPLGYT